MNIIIKYVFQPISSSAAAASPLPHAFWNECPESSNNTQFSINIDVSVYSFQLCLRFNQLRKSAIRHRAHNLDGTIVTCCSFILALCDTRVHKIRLTFWVNRDKRKFTLSCVDVISMKLTFTFVHIEFYTLNAHIYLISKTHFTTAFA